MQYSLAANRLLCQRTMTRRALEREREPMREVDERKERLRKRKEATLLSTRDPLTPHRVGTTVGAHHPTLNL